MITLKLFCKIVLIFILLISGCKNYNNQKDLKLTMTDSCGDYGAPPMKTIYPVTFPLECRDGQLLTFQQNSVKRYACLNYPDQSQNENHKWPMIVYLHGSIVSPMSIYTYGKIFFEMRDSYQLSDNPETNGFILLSPEGRIAQPFEGPDPESGKGLHWDTWYRNPDDNIDAAAIDHFVDEVVAGGKVDINRIYVFGWSNGAFMTVLYSSWRSDRIAAMGQYAGANPWTRTPCPVSVKFNRQVPLFLIRNLCDYFVTCSLSSQWIKDLDSLKWPYVYRSLNYTGDTVAQNSDCYPENDCGKYISIANHVRWPEKYVLVNMLNYFKENPLK